MKINTTFFTLVAALAVLPINGAHRLAVVKRVSQTPLMPHTVRTLQRSQVPMRTMKKISEERLKKLEKSERELKELNNLFSALHRGLTEPLWKTRSHLKNAALGTGAGLLWYCITDSDENKTVNKPLAIGFSLTAARLAGGPIGFYTWGATGITHITYKSLKEIGKYGFTNEFHGGNGRSKLTESPGITCLAYEHVQALRNKFPKQVKITEAMRNAEKQKEFDQDYQRTNNN
jgi:hypothetical protein